MCFMPDTVVTASHILPHLFLIMYYVTGIIPNIQTTKDGLNNLPSVTTVIKWQKWASIPGLPDSRAHLLDQLIQSTGSLLGL